MINDTWWLDELEREGKPRRMWIVARDEDDAVYLKQLPSGVEWQHVDDTTLGFGMTAREALANAFGYSDANDQSD